MEESKVQEDDIEFEDKEALRIKEALNEKLNLKNVCIPNYLQNEGSKEQIIQYNQDLKALCCKKCTYIVIEPLYCDFCQKIFCKKCTSTKGNSSICPECMKSKKEYPISLRSIDQFTLKNLLQLKFNCKYSQKQNQGHKQECLKIDMTYEEAIEHLNQCEFKLFECPNQCFIQAQAFFPKNQQFRNQLQRYIYGFDLKDHLERCIFQKLNCQKCGLKMFRYQLKEHDCKKDLQLKNEEIRRSKYDNFIKHGLLQDLYELKCIQNHQMYLQRGFCGSQSYEINKTCQCGSSYLEKQDFYYKCRNCLNYNICRQCALIKLNVFKREIKVPFHKCPLKQNVTQSNWRCDSANDDQQIFTKKMCESQITNFAQAHCIQRWQCQRCDFDQCLKCVLKYSFSDTNIQQHELKQFHFVFAEQENLHQLFNIQNKKFIYLQESYEFFQKMQEYNLYKFYKLSQNLQSCILVQNCQVVAQFGSYGGIQKLQQVTFEKYFVTQNMETLDFNHDQNQVQILICDGENIEDIIILNSQQEKELRELKENLIFFYEKKVTMAVFKQNVLTSIQFLNKCEEDGNQPIFFNQFSNIRKLALKLNYFSEFTDQIIDDKQYYVYWLLENFEKNEVYKNHFENLQAAKIFFAKLGQNIAKIFVFDKKIVDSNKKENYELLNQECFEQAQKDGIL